MILLIVLGVLSVAIVGWTFYGRLRFNFYAPRYWSITFWSLFIAFVAVFGWIALFASDVPHAD